MLGNHFVMDEQLFNAAPEIAAEFDLIRTESHAARVINIGITDLLTPLHLQRISLL